MAKSKDVAVPAAEINLFDIPEQISYEDLVTRWQQTDSAFQWIRGDIAIRVKARMQDFAREVGVSYKTLLAYRQVAEAYPPGSRRLEVSWSVHQALTSQEDHLELVASRTWTLKEARELVDRRNRAALPPLAPPAPSPAPPQAEPVEEYTGPSLSEMLLGGKPGEEKPPKPEVTLEVIPEPVKEGTVVPKLFGDAGKVADAYAALSDREKNAVLDIIVKPGAQVPVNKRFDQYRADNGRLKDRLTQVEARLAEATRGNPDLEDDEEVMPGSGY